jgi:AcrR family transcriptional regulator
MTKQKAHNRERIIEIANRLFYEKGYNQTSFADVANEIDISKGNMTYHFRSKNELLNAVIDHRMDEIKENLQQWNKEYPEPVNRLKRFVKILLNESDNLVRYGCPMGSLNVELGKSQRDLQEKSKQMFELFKQWLDEAFKQIGCNEYNKKSNHLLSMAQGAALMAYVYSDRELLEAECEHMVEWIESMK